MTVPTSMTSLSTTASANPPAGGDTPSTLDDHQRQAYAFIKTLYDTKAPVASPTFTGNITTNGSITNGGTFISSVGVITTAGNIVSSANISTSTGTISGSVITGTTVRQTSDRKLKTDLRRLLGNSEIIEAIADAAYTFRWKADGREDVGFVAQYLHEAEPRAVFKDQDGMLSISLAPVVAHLVAHAWELEQRVAALEQS